MAGASIIGALRVNLGLDSALFQKGAKVAQNASSRLEKSLGKFADKAEQIGKKLSVVSAGMAAMGAAGLAFANQYSQAGVEIDRFSKLAGAAPDQFQRWAAGAKRAGIEQDKMADILKDVNDKVGDFFETGGGPMADFFENVAPKIGLTAEAFRGLSGPDALQLYVSSLEKAGLNQQQMTFYMEALASDATALLPLLLNNGKAMQQYGDAAAASGAIMSDKAVAASVKFKESLSKLQEAFSGVQNKLAEHLLPVMTRFVDKITTTVIPVLLQVAEKIGDWIKWFGDLSPAVQDAAAAMGLALGTSGPILLAVAAISNGFKMLLGTGPLGAFMLIATTGIAVWQTWGEDIKAAIGGAVDWISGKIETLVGWLQGVADKAVAIKDAVLGVFSLGSSEMNSGSGYGGMAGAGDEFSAGMYAGDQMAAGIVQGTGAGISARKAELEAYINQLPETAKEVLDIHSPSRVFAQIGQFIAAGLGLGIQQGQSGVTGAMAGVVDAVEGDGQSLSGSMQSFAQSAKSAFRSVVLESGKVKDALSQLASQWLSSMGSNLFNAGFNGLMGAIGLPGFATGTPYAPGGLARINERGGEIVNLPRGSQVIPHDISKRMADRASTPAAGGHLSIGFDQSTNSLTATMYDVAGRVVAQERSGIVGQSVQASASASRKSKSVFGVR